MLPQGEARNEALFFYDKKPPPECLAVLIHPSFHSTALNIKLGSGGGMGQTPIGDGPDQTTDQYLLMGMSWKLLQAPSILSVLVHVISQHLMRSGTMVPFYKRKVSERLT